MTLRDCIAIHDAAQSGCVGLTPLGAATLAARRFSEALQAVTPQERERLLAQVVVSAEAGPDGTGFSLLISRPPTSDPAA